MEFKQDDADASNCMRTKAKQHTETVTNICPSPGQYRLFPLLSYVCSVIKEVGKDKRCSFETAREK